MDGGVGVPEGLAGREEGGGGGAFDLVELAELGPVDGAVVVGIDSIAFERLFLKFPEGIDVIGFALSFRQGEVSDGQGS